MKRNGRKIAALYFSPRVPSNSGELMDAALEPAIGSKIAVERIFVRNLDIRPCVNCGACRRGLKCPIADDMPRVRDVLEDCIAVAIATPVYFYGVPAKAKALIDRCQTFWARKYINANPLPYGRQAGIIVTAESSGKKVAEGVRLTLKYFLDALSIEMPDMQVVRNCVWKPGEAPEEQIAEALEYGKNFLERINHGA